MKGTESLLSDLRPRDEWGKPLDQAALDAALDAAPDGSDWWFDGRDLFYKPAGSNVDQVIVPLPETWHESQEVPQAVGHLIATAVNFLRASRGWTDSGTTRCEQCNLRRGGTPIETVGGRGPGWKCLSCRWWNWL